MSRVSFSPAARIVVATICAVALDQRTYGSLEPVRARIVRAPIAGDLYQSLDVRFDGSPELIHVPLAIILRVSNSSRSAARVEVRFEDLRLGSFVIGPETIRRVDLQAPTGLAGAPGHLVFRADAPGTQLQYVEVANRHGDSHGIVNLVIAPAGARRPKSVPRPAAVLLWGLLVVVTLAWARSPIAMARRGLRVLQVSGVALLTIALLSPWTSKFLVLISWRTWLLCLTCIYGPVLVDAARSAYAGIAARDPERARIVILGASAVAVFAYFLSVMAHMLITLHGGNYSGFIHITRRTIDATPFLVGRPDLAASLRTSAEAYDGQYAYLMAFDPWLRRHRDDPEQYLSYIDAPPYRYPRVAFSAIVHSVSIGDPRRFPAVMTWTILAAIGVGALCIALLAKVRGAPAWMVLLYASIPAFAQSIGFSLPEPLAAALLLAAVSAYLARRIYVAAACLAVSLLVRETGAIVLGVLIGVELGRRRYWGATLLAGAFAPVAVWRLFICWLFFDHYGWSGVLFNPRNTTFPLGGVLETWQHIGRGEYPREIVTGAVALPCLLGAGLAVGVVNAIRRRDPVFVAASIYTAVPLCLSYSQSWAHIVNIERTSFEAFVLLLIGAVASSTHRDKLWYCTIGFFGLAFLYNFRFAHQAEFLRAALLVVR